MKNMSYPINYDPPQATFVKPFFRKGYDEDRISAELRDRNLRRAVRALGRARGEDAAARAHLKSFEELKRHDWLVTVIGALSNSSFTARTPSSSWDIHEANANRKLSNAIVDELAEIYKDQILEGYDTDFSRTQTELQWLFLRHHFLRLSKFKQAVLWTCGVPDGALDLEGFELSEWRLHPNDHPNAVPERRALWSTDLDKQTAPDFHHIIDEVRRIERQGEGK